MSRSIYHLCNDRYKYYLNSDEYISTVITKTYEILLYLIGNKNDEECYLFFDTNIVKFKYIDKDIIYFENFQDFLNKINTIDNYDFYIKINIFLTIIKTTNDISFENEKINYESNKRVRYN